MSFTLIAAAALAASPASPHAPPPRADDAAPGCTGAICNTDTLVPYFAKLAGAKGGPMAKRVHILQIGDSHTAGDQITGAWRSELQARYGVGGRGVLAPGRPYQGYLTRGVTASMSSGWSIDSTFGKSWHEVHAPLGLSGFSLTASQAGATIGLTTDYPEMNFDRFTLCAIAKPDAGMVTVRYGDGTEQGIDLSSPIEYPLCTTLRPPRRQSSVLVTALNPGQQITSWATFRDDGGVALSNVGVVGSQLQHFARTDDSVLTAELDAYEPDLIVVAFGTNEGFSPSFTASSYERMLRSQIARIRRLAGEVPILLLGAPDALSRQPGLRTNASYGIVDCPAPDPGPLTLASSSPPLFAPPALAQVRGVQRRVAGELHLAFWDWQARMGGACAAQDWVKGDAPRMRGDYVHFTTAGAREIAKRLQADLAVPPAFRR